MATPTLDYNPITNTLVITGGTSADPVTFNDVAAVNPSETTIDEVIADAIYVIHANIEFGDGSTATYFASELESVYFTEQYFPHVKSNATLRIGNVEGDFGYKGSYWSFDLAVSFTNILQSASTTANLYIYASKLTFRATSNIALYFNGGNIIIKNSILDGTEKQGRYYFGGSVNDLQMEDMYLTYVANPQFTSSPTLSKNLHFHHLTTGITIGNAGLELTDVRITNNAGSQILINTDNDTLNLINPITTISNVAINGTAGDEDCTVKYTYDLTITDDDDNPLSGITVTCYDSTDAEVFSVTTSGDGTIAQQQIRWKQWLGPSVTLTDYSPIRFVFSRAGHPDINIKDFTPTDKMVWVLKWVDSFENVAYQAFYLSQPNIS